MRWIRIILVTGGLYHLLFALWAILCPTHALGWLDCTAAGQPMLWQMFGVISAILGLGLMIAAKNPIQHWPIVLLGFIESVITISMIGSAVFNGDLPSTALLMLAVNDMIWLPLFGLILWAALRANTGIPPSRNQPYSIEEAASIYQLSDGRTTPFSPCSVRPFRVFHVLGEKANS